MVKSDIDYKTDKVFTDLGALSFLKWQGYTPEMVNQAVEEIRSSIDEYLEAENGTIN